jgi:hypothetical protein
MVDAAEVLVELSLTCMKLSRAYNERRRFGMQVSSIELKRQKTRY